MSSFVSSPFFFFQAEGGIRDVAVTGVQTCALPIARPRRATRPHVSHAQVPVYGGRRRLEIGRASCRERVYISVVAVSLKKKNIPDTPIQLQCVTDCLNEDAQAAERSKV